MRRLDEGTVLFRGEGDLTYVCGRWRAPVIVNVAPGHIRNVVIICNRAVGDCGRSNETLD
jgi:hypothetical protein